MTHQRDAAAVVGEESAAAPMRLDAWTVGAIAVVAYAFTSVLHEGLGHGGACLLAGGWPQALNAIYFSYDTASVSPLSVRVIAAAGTLVNARVGVLALAGLHFTGRPGASGRYFLWLLACVGARFLSGLDCIRSRHSGLI